MKCVIYLVLFIYLSTVRCQFLNSLTVTIDCVSCRVREEDRGLVCGMAFMGAPAILFEKLPGGQETRLALSALRRVLASGVCEGVECGKASSGGVEVVDKTYSWIDGSQFTAYIATNETLKNVDMTNVPNVSPSHR